MAKLAKTCKITVSNSLYADWLVAEHPERWVRGGNGQAVQRLALVGEYWAPKGLRGSGWELKGVYDAV